MKLFGGHITATNESRLNVHYLSRFGFNFDNRSAHTKRTMMLRELSSLFEAVRTVDAPKAEYYRLIVSENCLGKQTLNNRNYTASYLEDLYGLDPSLIIFRALRYYWERDREGIPLLTILCTYSRDGLVRASTPYILGLPEGTHPHKSDLESLILNLFPNRFGYKMIQSLVRNLLSTWTQSGHLSGKVRKVRSRATPTSGAVSYALLLGYLAGIRGENLFKSEYANLLDCSFERRLELAEEASRRGWIILKRIGNVIEVLFPNLIRAREMEWILEQN